MKSPAILLTAIMAVALCGAAAARPAHVTIELDNCAIVIWADEKEIDEVDVWAAELDKSGIGTKDIEKMVKEKFGGPMKMEVFEAGKPAAAGAEERRMSLRAAVLEGQTPPIEGLRIDEAMIVLMMFGFTAVTEREFAAFSEQDRIRKMIIGGGPLVVISGTAPFDEITLYVRPERKDKK